MKQRCPWNRIYQLVVTSLLFLFFTESYSAQVIINEIGVAPTCASCDAAGGGEWIELYNTCSVTVPIGCYVIVFQSESGAGVGGNATGFTITIPSGTTLASGAYYVIGGSGQQYPTTGVWGNTTSGTANAWDNPALAAVDLDVATNGINTSINSMQVGNYVNARGEVFLLDYTGSVQSSVSWNQASFGGSPPSSNANNYPCFSQAPAGCTALNPINSLPDPANDVVATFSATVGAGKSHTIELLSTGVYQAIATEGTPGAANSTQMGHAISCTLPIELSEFIGERAGKKVDLNWTTQSETNNAYFTLERSSDGMNFEEITQVKGAGNSSSVLHYVYSDDGAPSGTCYYRLKQTDFNGQSTNSKDISIKPLHYFAVQNVYPNPATQQLNVSIQQESANNLVINIYNAEGKRVYMAAKSIAEKSNTVQIDLNDLPAGIYLLTIQGPNTNYQSKFVKE
jgi:hypothetical protein